MAMLHRHLGVQRYRKIVVPSNITCFVAPSLPLATTKLSKSFLGLAIKLEVGYLFILSFDCMCAKQSWWWLDHKYAFSLLISVKFDIRILSATVLVQHTLFFKITNAPGDAFSTLVWYLFWLCLVINQVSMDAKCMYSHPRQTVAQHVITFRRYNKLHGVPVSF